MGTDSDAMDSPASPMNPVGWNDVRHDVFHSASLSDRLGFPNYIARGASAAAIALLLPQQLAAEYALSSRGT